MGIMDREQEGKLKQLREILGGMDKVLVAFSGGADSTFLVKMAIEVLGKEQVIAVTAQSPTYPSWECKESKELALLLGARQVMITTEELDKDDFAANPPERCYFCKEELFSRLVLMAADEGAGFVLDGTNRDDLGDFRPGRKAAQEKGVRSPLLEAGLTKGDIRLFSREMGLPTWNKPACACLSSRFPYGTRITEEKLRQVERGEDYLRSLGFGQYRLRHHGEVVRIEINREQFPLMMEKASDVVSALKAAGFAYVALDLEGYRTGSMNESLPVRGSSA
jgi:uncharacterized protein